MNLEAMYIVIQHEHMLALLHVESHTDKIFSKLAVCTEIARYVRDYWLTVALGSLLILRGTNSI